MSLQSAAMQHSPAVEFKGSVFTLTILVLRRVDADAIRADIRARLVQAPQFFLNAPVVLDLAPVKDEAAALDFAALAALLREEKLVPVGVRNGSQAQSEAAVAAGLAVMTSGDRGTPLPQAAQAEPVPEKAQVAPAPVAAAPVPTKVITQPVRSGQQIYARGGDLVLLAQVNAGAEVIADGNIHVYAPLRGRALAGVQGDTSARIFSLNFGPEMVAIAGHYRVFEEQDGCDALGKQAQVALDGEKLLITLLT